MKSNIDSTVAAILANLARASNTMLQAALAPYGLDGISGAIEQRAALERWAEDPTLSEEDRAYADEKLRALPDF